MVFLPTESFHDFMELGLEGDWMHPSAKKAGILQPPIRHTSRKRNAPHATAKHLKPIQAGSCPSLVSALLKRLGDILCASVGLILCAPFLFLCVLIVRLDSPGPAFYSQERVTRNEKVFRIYKFRTMVQNAEAFTGGILASADDPRITRVGKVLRNTHLDELPQLFNILKGDMSLVGPRPERPMFVEKYKATVDQYEQRFLVRAGLTGTAQVYGHYHTDISEKTAYDLWYIEHFSLRQDIKLIALTVKVLLEGRPLQTAPEKPAHPSSKLSNPRIVK